MNDALRVRPPWDQYYLRIASEAASRSNCIRKAVGAIIVKEKAIISTGYNGTPIGALNCYEGGCPRCASDTPSGQGYDNCICVHAEQNAIVLAARHGTRTEGGELYSTLRPCFGCVKEAIQAGIKKIIYLEHIEYPQELETTYEDLISQTRLKVRQYRSQYPDGG